MAEYQLSPSILRRDGGTQPRAALDEATIQEYADAMTAGDVFPAVVAFHDGDAYWLADGFHRVNAALRSGVVLLPVDVRQGTQREAVLYSAGVNATHGLRRTNEDKRRAVTRLLSDAEWAQWSDREIGRRCHVHHETVAAVRASLTGDFASDNRTYITKHGTQAVMHTAAIGQPAQSEQIGRQPANQAFAPVWELENALYAHLRASIPMGDDWLYVAEVTLVELRERGDGAPRWPTVTAAMPPCRKNDLVQAINNTLEQVRQAQRRAAPVSVESKFVEDQPSIGTRMESGEPFEADERASKPFTKPCSTNSRAAELVAEPAEAGFQSPAHIGHVTIHQADARDLVRLFGLSLSVDLIVTSPPYNTGGEIQYDGHGDDMDTAEYFDFLADVFAACYSVLSPGGRICVNVPFGMSRQPWRPVAGPLADLLVSGTAGGLQLEGQIVWDKGTTGNRTSWGSWRRPTHPSLRDTCEAVIVARKLGTPALPPGALVADDAGGPDVSPWLPGEVFMSLTQDHWQIAPESATRVGHPAPFPVQLAENLVRLYGWPGCTILDPFAGAGTVGVAVLGLPAGERCRVILVDQSAQYCGLAAGRVRKTAVRLPV